MIAYRRPFTTGRALLLGRQGIPLRLFAATPGLEAHLDTAHGGVHGRLLDDANLYIAHRVGPAEQAAVGLLLAPPGEPPEVLAVQHFSIRRVGPANGDLPRVLALLNELVPIAEGLVEHVRRKLLEWARERPPTDWYAGLM